MNRSLPMALALSAALATGACSTRPRQFSASVRPVAEAPQSAMAVPGEGGAFAACDTMVRKGRKGGFAAAAATGGAGLAAAAATTGSVVLTGATSTTAFAAPSALATAAVPVVGVLAAFGMNRLIRGGRERGYRKHMGSCLGEMGYQVVDWSRARKKQPGTATLVPSAMRPAPSLVTTAPAADPAETPAEAPAEATVAVAPLSR